ncbi:unnamed protein product [Adineta steineri]|uniref:Carbonic anhydrase n=1 Tax=Adineta steineri TaxID=433720 RepID=A0A814GKI5_9BILA|nr:unnamed protein product [Adineta steineri]
MCELWNYHDLGPDVWSDTYPTCAAHSQSPINIQTACTDYQSFTPFSFQSGYNLTHNFTLHNNGHTIVGRYTGNSSTTYTLTGGGLNGTYEFLQFHLHWGENYKSGSEHQVNGMKYAGEIHFVHRNIQTLKLAVLGFFMESIPNTSASNTTHTTKTSDISETNNSTLLEWQKYFAVSEYLRVINNATTVNLNLSSLMGNNVGNFWRYDGSLTTPPCTEGVIWTVFKVPTIFMENELASFRSNIYFEDYRGPQPLYDRTVYRNFLVDEVSSIPDYTCCLKSSSNSMRKLFDLNNLLVEGLKYILSFIIIFCTMF